MKFDDKYDERYIRYLMSVLAKIDGLFSDVAGEVSSPVFPYLSPGEYFSFDKNKKLGGKIEKIIKKAGESILAQLAAAIAFVWSLSNSKNDAFVKKIFEKTAGAKLPKVYTSPNPEGLNRFRTRKVHGLRLSGRVWKYTGTLHSELEQAVNAAVEKGMSAAQLSKEVRKYLKNPDALYRRVRDRNGRLVLSKSALKYNPGQGVYRSAYKIAMRLARTEINRTYHRADFERGQQLPVVGIFRI
jgi:hypothetical protein